MSTVVDMSQTVGDYQSGSTYRVRSRNAQDFQDNAQATIIDDVSVQVSDPIEGV